MLRRGATPPPIKSHDEASQQGITHPPLTSRMQFPQNPHLQQTANGRISTIRVHNLECLEGNYMRRCPRLMNGRRDRRAWLRCPWAAAGPGRTTSRRAERSSRRGRLAGEPPPTGTHSSPARRTARPAPGTPAAPQPQTQKSGPEPLGSGPPSMLSGDQQYTTRISSARPPCHPCRSSRR